MSATTTQTSNISKKKMDVPPMPPEPHQKAAMVIALRAGEGDGEAVYLRLGALRVDERNVRTDGLVDSELELLADLIDAQGLLQNLIVIAYATPVRGTGKDRKKLFTHGVIAGGRRLRALLLLVQRGRLTLDDEILCTLVPESRALAVSAAENSGREPMSTADTIVAFAEMVKGGAGVQELAVCFGLSPLTVQRRLRLANVSPAMFDLFRQEKMSVDQLMALALTEDHAAQEGAWAAAPDYDRSPRVLRSLIAGAGLSKNIVKFVGLPAYKKAGGTVLLDLFSDEEENPAYVQDAGLMMRLATEKLERIATGLRDEGAAWTEVFTSFGYSEREQFANPPVTRREPTEAEARALAELQAKTDAVDEKLQAIYSKDGESEGDAEEIQRLEDEAEALGREREAIDEGMEVVRADVAALVGGVVYIDHNGKAEILRNRVRKADAAALKKAAGKPAGGVVGGAAVDEKGGVSDRLCHQLTAHRTRALQASLLSNEVVALAALVHPLLVRVVYGGSAWCSQSALQVEAKDCDQQLRTWAPDLDEARAEKLVQARLEQTRAMLPAEVGELLAWLLGQPVDVLVQLLTLAAALSLNAITGNGKTETTRAIAAAVKLDMAEWWTPTVGGYLGAVSKSLIAEAVTEAGLPEDAKAIEKMKKADAAARAEELLAGKGWLPTVLR